MFAKETEEVNTVLIDFICLLIGATMILFWGKRAHHLVASFACFLGAASSILACNLILGFILLHMGCFGIHERYEAKP